MGIENEGRIRMSKGILSKRVKGCGPLLKMNPQMYRGVVVKYDYIFKYIICLLEKLPSRHGIEC